MNHRSLLLLLCTFFQLPLLGQSWSDSEILQGYKHENGITTFIFNPEAYALDKVQDVILTGSFRNWSTDMKNLDWQLKPQGELWILRVKNPNYEVISPSSEFKYRANNGLWLDPPNDAPNRKGGNLVFEQHIKPPQLSAEIRSEKAIWLISSGFERGLFPGNYVLEDAAGKQIPIAEVWPNTNNETLLIPAQKLDKRRPYFIYPITHPELKTWVSYDGWFRTLYSDKELGANISEDKTTTTFRLFAPRAIGVKLHLYGVENTETAESVHQMVKDEQGVWEFSINKNLFKTWYDFRIHGFDDPGNHFFEQIGEHVSDPYARVNDDAWGRSRVWEKGIPASPLKNGRPAIEDVIAYEVHVQDFTDLLPVTDSEKGTFLAMIKPGLKNSLGQAIGFDHLINLGINTVHLMPVQEFLNYPDEEWQEAFADDAFMKKHKINMENYQWGYRTTQAMAVETRFRKKGSEHGAQREQFRDLVQAFHKKDIAVIIDIVPNHTGENMDGLNYYFNFNGIDKIYYYRTKNLNHIGEYGNEVKTENRPMTQRWLIDQCKHFIEEFGIDGFRIDLAGQIDEQTLIKLRQALGEDIIIYGEPWIASADPNYEANPAWDWYKEDSPITYFNDDTRNAYKGPVFDLFYGEKSRGFAGGNAEERAHVVKGLQNYFPTEKKPSSGIAYLDIHDNWALADQFANNEELNGLKGILEPAYKMAAVLLYTTQGPIVTHGGVEIVRSKASAELKETIKETKKGLNVYLHGKRDTYNMRAPNQFRWETVGLTAKQAQNGIDYRGIHRFFQGLNAMRNSEFGNIFKNKTRVPDDYYQFFLPDNEALLAYTVADQLLVVMNVGQTTDVIKNISLPKGKWMLVGSNQGFDHEKGIRSPRKWRTLKSGSQNIELSAQEFLVWRNMN